MANSSRAPLSAGGPRPLSRSLYHITNQEKRHQGAFPIVHSVQLLDRDCDALAHADAHGGERKLAAAPFHAMDRGEREPGAAHAERMAERNRAAMRITKSASSLTP